MALCEDLQGCYEVWRKGWTTLTASSGELPADVSFKPTFHYWYDPIYAVPGKRSEDQITLVRPSWSAREDSE